MGGTAPLLDELHDEVVRQLRDRVAQRRGIQLHGRTADPLGVHPPEPEMIMELAGQQQLQCYTSSERVVAQQLWREDMPERMRPYTYRARLAR